MSSIHSCQYCSTVLVHLPNLSSVNTSCILGEDSSTTYKVTSCHLRYDEAVTGASGGCSFMQWAISMPSAKEHTNLYAQWTSLKPVDGELFDVSSAEVEWAESMHKFRIGGLGNDMLLCSEARGGPTFTDPKCPQNSH